MNIFFVGLEIYDTFKGVLLKLYGGIGWMVKLSFARKYFLRVYGPLLKKTFYSTRYFFEEAYFQDGPFKMPKMAKIG